MTCTVTEVVAKNTAYIDESISVWKGDMEKDGGMSLGRYKRYR